MIKKAFLSLIILSLIAFLTSSVFAQNNERTTADQNRDRKIEDLKERVASKVAQLHIPLFKALTGEVTSVAKDSFLLKTSQGEKTVKLDEEVKIFRLSPGKKLPIILSNLKKGDGVAAIGSNDAQGVFTAKVILTKTLPQNINGIVEKTDQTNFTISVKDQKGVIYLVDIESTTKVQSWDKAKGLIKIGFSKIQNGDRVHVNGQIVPKEENRISAIRILVLPGQAAGISGKSATPSAQTPTPTSKPWPDG